jgi:hypothetical protein
MGLPSAIAATGLRHGLLAHAVGARWSDFALVVDVMAYLLAAA